MSMATGLLVNDEHLPFSDITYIKGSKHRKNTRVIMFDVKTIIIGHSFI